MKRGVLGTVLMMFGMVMAFAAPAVASPPDTGQCIDCHAIDPNVVVSTTFHACAGATAVYSASVNDPYGFASYGLFRLSDSAKLKYGFGGYTTFAVAPNTGFSFQGVSATTYQLGGANAVEFVSPNCQVTCTDTDGDTYNYEAVNCGPRDCNDANPAIHPGAAEVRFDGIDQDCNGYDLTINITRADWSRSKKRLTVTATSSRGANAALQLDGYGAMTYVSGSGLWSKIVTISANPGTVTVSGPEGSWSGPVTSVK